MIQFESIPAWYIIFDVVKDIFIVVIAAFGLKTILYAKAQVKVIREQTIATRNQFKTRNDREAITIAIKLSEKFPDIMNTHSELISQSKGVLHGAKKQLKPYIEDIINSNTNCIEKISEKIAKRTYNSLIPFINDMYTIANNLEALSMNFINNVADEKSVYPSIAPAFCDMFEDLYLVIILNRCMSCGNCDTQKTEHKYKFYTYSLSLYKIWKTRLLDDKLTYRMSTILNKKEELRKK